MKRNIFYLSVFVLVFYCLTGIAKDIKITKDFGDFSGISLSCDADLYLKQGDENSVIIEINEDILSKIDINVSGDTLKIKENNSSWFSWGSIFKSKTFNIYVTMKEIKNLAAATSGKIKLETDILSDDLTLAATSSGDIIAKNINAKNISIKTSSSGDIETKDINAQNITVASNSSGDIETGKIIVSGNIEISCSSSGDIEIDYIEAKNLNAGVSSNGDIEILSGKVNNHEASASSSGKYDAENVVSKTGVAEASSSGRVIMNVTDEASVNVSSSGRLYLYGNPRMKNLSVSSSGKNIYEIKM